jgi:uncharacterized protein YcbK (DUF882 family)
MLLAGQNLVLIEVVEVQQSRKRGCKTRSQHCFAASTRFPIFRVELKQLTSAAMAGRGGGYALMGRFWIGLSAS